MTMRKTLPKIKSIGLEGTSEGLCFTALINKEGEMFSFVSCGGKQPVTDASRIRRTSDASQVIKLGREHLFLELSLLDFGPHNRP